MISETVMLSKIVLVSSLNKVRENVEVWMRPKTLKNRIYWEPMLNYKTGLPLFPIPHIWHCTWISWLTESRNIFSSTTFLCLSSFWSELAIASLEAKFLVGNFTRSETWNARCIQISVLQKSVLTVFHVFWVGLQRLLKDSNCRVVFHKPCMYIPHMSIH